MAIRQISVFVENKKGSLSDVTDLLSKNGIDLRAMSIADTADFGILRIIVEETDRALSILRDNGIIATVTEVTAFAVPDRTGGLAEVLHILSERNINMEYLYALVTKVAGKAFTVMRVEDNSVTEDILEENGIEILREEDL